MERPPSDYQVLNSRLEELKNQLQFGVNLVRIKFHDIIKHNLSVQANRDVVAYGNARWNNAIRDTDAFWVQAMSEEGISDSTILRVWNKKDEMSRNIRDETDTV